MNQQQEIETQDRVAAYYEDVRYALPWSRTYHTWLFRHMITLLKPEGKILDAGCGNGWLGEFLPKENLYGIDISPEMIAYAKTRLGHAEIGDVEALPYPDAFFDAVFARSVIHHLPHPEVGVKELIRVLKPGGRIIFLDTLNRNVFSKIFRKKMNEGDHFSELHQNMEEKTYCALITTYAQIEKIEYVGYLGYTLLGFPDVLNIYRFIPCKQLFTPLLMLIDQAWAKIPFINKLGLGIILVAKKRYV